MISDILDHMRVKRGVDVKLKILHTPGYTTDFGNLELDHHLSMTIQKYGKLQDLLTGDYHFTQLIKKYVWLWRYFKNLEMEHGDQCHNPQSGIHFQVGDSVSIKTDAQSKSYYGITEKFLPHYSGYFQITHKLGDNTFLLQETDGEQLYGIPFAANVRRLQRVD